MLYIRSLQISLFLCSFLWLSNVQGQRALNRPGHDEMSYYFGLQLGYASMDFNTNKHPKFLQDDSIYSAEPGASGGFAVGFIATKKLNTHWQARIAPQLILGGARSFTYHLKYPNAIQTEFYKKNLTSTFLSFPLQFKFNSDRIDNFRVYMLGGLSYDVDLASNSNARNAEDLIKLKPADFGVQAGVGFNFYLKFVTLSPEIKISTGLTNVHARDPYLQFSSVFDKLYSRSIMFTLNIEE